MCACGRTVNETHTANRGDWGAGAGSQKHTHGVVGEVYSGVLQEQRAATRATPTAAQAPHHHTNMRPAQHHSKADNMRPRAEQRSMRPQECCGGQWTPCGPNRLRQLTHDRLRALCWQPGSGRVWAEVVATQPQAARPTVVCCVRPPVWPTGALMLLLSLLRANGCAVGVRSAQQFFCALCTFLAERDKI